METKIHRIELHNFKSYAGDITIGPFKDFTCIVGPNGSGKSNLMDALSFVLSDPNLSNDRAPKGNSNQSNVNLGTLRTKKLSDLINRNATTKECSVTIVLRHLQGSGSNSKQVETSFTRTVDKDGNTKVLINNKKVTEQQFKGLLEKNHKISKRVSNFLVFQHEVDRVAQKKAKELTELFEDVSCSGELKGEYNAKKKALEEANEEVTKASFEKRSAVAAVNQMKLAKKETEKYENIRREYVEGKRDVALTELFHIETELELQKEELTKFTDRLDEMQKKIASEESIRALKRTWAEQHKLYTEELQKCRKSADEVRSSNDTLGRIKAALSHLTRKLAQHKVTLENATKNDNARSKEVQRLEEEKKKQIALLAKLKESWKAKDEENIAAQKSLNKEEKAEYLRLKREAECETVTLRQQRDTIQRRQVSITEAVKNADRAIENLHQQKREFDEQVQQITKSNDELEKRKQDLLEKVQEMESNLRKEKAALSVTQQKNKEREAELVKLQEQMHEFRHLKDTDRQNTRMADALQALKSLFPIKGRLVDLCTIPNEKYRNAVTVAMGKNLEAIVVDTTEIGLSCVRYLKEQRLSPMTFLPLDTVQGKPVDDRLRTFGGTCKPVIDVVRFDADVQPAVAFALGQTLVCDSMTEAKKVAFGNSNGERFKVVTVDGTMLLKNGSVQGGLASVQSRAKKWDEKRYEDLRAARDRLLNEEAGGSEAELARINVTIRDLESRLEFSRHHLNSLQTDSKKNQERLKSVQNEIKRLDEVIKNVERKKKIREGDSVEAEKSLAEVNRAISVIEDRIFKDFQKKVNITSLLNLEESEIQQERSRAEAEQKIQLLIHHLDSTIETESRHFGSESAKELHENYTKAEKEEAQCKKDLVAYQAIVDKAVKKHESLKASVAILRGKMEDLEAKVRETSRNSESELQRLAKARKGVVVLHSACDILRMRRMNVVRRCQMEETDIPLKPASAASNVRAKRGRQSDTSRADLGNLLLLSEPFEIVSDSTSGKHSKSEEMVCIDFSSLTDALRQVGGDRTRFQAYKQRTETQLESLASQMEALAPNMKVASHYVATEDRLESSSSQLEACREKARKAHAEFIQVKELRTQRFMQVYDKIAANVDRIYQELTMGTRAHGVTGSAYLGLEDVEEPYLGGTTYHATPPMKRFMPMELLSGGERTMAALALLFAIHAVAPTPFFVLDEVDAALDAGNAGKLATYLSKNCKDCQFIVVSLKDQLYHLGDMLVGVMKDKEKGSSNILTLDLRGYPF